MVTTRLHFADDARRRIVRGATQVARLVELTLGPAARTVLIERAPAGPLVGSSGYDVALHVELVCPVEQIGAQAMRNVAWEVSDRWGDGTATVVCLAAALLQSLDRAETRGCERRALAEALDAEIDEVVAALTRSATPVMEDDDLRRVIETAAGGPDLSPLLFEAALRAGPQGYVDVVPAAESDALEVVQGLAFDGGWLSPSFAASGADRIVLENTYVVAFDGAVQSIDEIGPMLDVFVRMDQPLLFVATSFSEDAKERLGSLVRRTGAKIAAMRAPGEGDWRRFHLGDIAAATGATLFGDEGGYSLRTVRPELIGRAKKVELTAKESRFYGGAGGLPELDFRKAQIRGDIARSRYLSLDRERHEKRLALFFSGIVTLSLGGRTEPERALRIGSAQRAVQAIRAARQSGSIAGGGLALRDAGRALGNGSITGRAFEAPFRALSVNGATDATVSPRDPCNLVIDVVRRAAATAASLVSTNVAITHPRRLAN
ncbi:TCP-1/cpn60 chaperonin family protein [Shinella sp. M27]|uniref:TCP-1/cpn60 chaperonin family protein n=1 Tax=Shinella sp. M27 TaxID=3368614 RepID=UPI003BA00D38